jgi:hypothetical protein
VNVKSLLSRAAISQNVMLQANDILFIPSSATKRITGRVIEAGLNVGTGIAIWR